MGRYRAHTLRDPITPRAEAFDWVPCLCLALESEESRTGAVEAIRALIEAILLEPDGDELKITLKGDLAGMLSAAGDSKRSPDTGDLMVQIKLVAGAPGNPARSAVVAVKTMFKSRPRNQQKKGRVVLATRPFKVGCGGGI